MEEWIDWGRTHFRSLALASFVSFSFPFTFSILFCPLAPPVELPVSVSYFRRLPATNGSVDTKDEHRRDTMGVRRNSWGKRFPQRSAPVHELIIVRDAEGQHSGIRMTAR